MSDSVPPDSAPSFLGRHRGQVGRVVHRNAVENTFWRNTNDEVAFRIYCSSAKLAAMITEQFGPQHFGVLGYPGEELAVPQRQGPPSALFGIARLGYRPPCGEGIRRPREIRALHKAA